jgi:hypothetical protein
MQYEHPVTLESSTSQNAWEHSAQPEIGGLFVRAPLIAVVTVDLGVCRKVDSKFDLGKVWKQVPLLQHIQLLDRANVNFHKCLTCDHRSRVWCCVPQGAYARRRLWQVLGVVVVGRLASDQPIAPIF